MRDLRSANYATFTHLFVMFFTARFLPGVYSKNYLIIWHAGNFLTIMHNNNNSCNVKG